MKEYLLLRDNHQSGPYSLEELREFLLEPKDLVWVEGKSSCWCYPSEMEELKDYICEKKRSPKNVFVSVPGVSTDLPASSAGADRNPAYPVGFDEFASVEKEHVALNTHLWENRKLSSMHQGLKVAAVFGGLVVGAVFMKKAVDGFDRPLADIQVPLTVIADAPANSPVTNALLTEVVPVTTTAEKAIRKIKPKDIKKQLTIKASDYTVGLLGGISNLQLKLFNSSPHSIDKITVAVQYLKPNGQVLETGHYEMYSIKPFSARWLPITDTKRGVKIKYKIVDIKSRDYTKAIKQL